MIARLFRKIRRWLHDKLRGRIVWFSVTSDAIVAVGYQRRSHTLAVQFRAGQVYLYRNVPPHVFHALVSAPSVGKYFNRYVRDQYRAIGV